MVAQLAREMVTRFGFSSLGPLALEGPGSEVFLGRDWFSQRPGYAESTGQAIDSQIRLLAKTALQQAISLLVDDLDYLNVNQRGYMVVTFTPQEARADWYFVETIKSRDYRIDAARTASRRVLPGQGNRTLEKVTAG